MRNRDGFVSAQSIEVDCALYTIQSQGELYQLYEYNNGAHLDYVIRRKDGTIVRHNDPEALLVFKIFTEHYDGTN